MTTKIAERAELAVEVRRGAFLDRSADLLHLGVPSPAASTSRRRTKPMARAARATTATTPTTMRSLASELDAPRRDCGGQGHPSSWFSGTLRPGNGMTAPLASEQPVAAGQDAARAGAV